MNRIVNKLLKSLLLVLLLPALTLQGQDDSKFKFGLHVAPSVNWIQVKDGGIDSRGGVANLNYGLCTDFALKGNNRYFISTGLNLISNGGAVFHRGVEVQNDQLFESENHMDITTRYLEVPLGLKLRSNEIGYSVIGGYFGFGTGFRVSAFQSGDVRWHNGQSSQEREVKRENIEDDINPMRFALIVGMEIERKITKDTYLTMGISFNNGLSNIFSGSGYDLNEGDTLDWASVRSNGEAQGSRLKATNKSLSIHLGIYF